MLKFSSLCVNQKFSYVQNYPLVTLGNQKASLFAEVALIDDVAELKESTPKKKEVPFPPSLSSIS